VYGSREEEDSKIPILSFTGSQVHAADSRWEPLLLRRLARTYTQGMLIKADQGAIRPFLEDASGMRGGHATRVCIPANEEEISSLLASCQKEGEPVTVSGAGTGLTGARIPFGGTVLATDKLTGIREIRDAGNGPGAAVLGPSVSLTQLERALAPHRLFHGPNPTEQEAWIGGTVATNASGSRTFRYGPTRRYVRRLRLVLPGGQILNLARGAQMAGNDGRFILKIDGSESIFGTLPSIRMPDSKNVSGYYAHPGMDLIDLFIGSEGTLGVISEVELDLLPAPEGVLAGILFFATEEHSWDFLLEARRQSYVSRGYAGPVSSTPDNPGPSGPAGNQVAVDARAIEYFDASSLKFMGSMGRRIPPAAGAAIYFEQEIRPGTEEGIQALWLELAQTHASLLDDSWIASNERDRREFRILRHSLPVGINEWLSRKGQRKIGADMAVPDRSFHQMMSMYRGVLNGTGLRWLAFGHLGDNHLHVNILPNDDAEGERGRAAYQEIVHQITSMGGTISAEHGLGKIKAAFLESMYGGEVFAQMKALKKAFDPALILGRGNMIPEDRLT
jgi:D-lactate dehydrogenase (cytochrome)